MVTSSKRSRSLSPQTFLANSVPDSNFSKRLYKSTELAELCS